MTGPNPTTTSSASAGELLRTWRQRRSLSQLELALRANVSARHVSFMETGRSNPSREMLLRLSEELDIPLRERNALLVAAGFAPVYSARSLDAPALQSAREAVDLVLKGHEPYPALAVDRHWTLITANSAVGTLLADVDPRLLEPPVNVLRLSLHPDGLGKRIANLEQWRTHVLSRLRQQVDATADEGLAALLDELRAGAPRGTSHAGGGEPLGVVIPLRIQTRFGSLSFISTTTVFGTPVDITLDELAIESFFPADPTTAEVLRRIAAGGSHPDA